MQDSCTVPVSWQQIRGRCPSAVELGEGFMGASIQMQVVAVLQAHGGSARNAAGPASQERCDSISRPCREASWRGPQSSSGVTIGWSKCSTQVELEGSPSAVFLVNACPEHANDGGEDVLHVFDERHLR